VDYLVACAEQLGYPEIALEFHSSQ
jgi:hypothetical protein